MAKRNLTTSLKTSSTTLDDIVAERDRLLSLYISYLRDLDEHDPTVWAEIVKRAREAGLEKDTLCQELSCAWSTILRWEAGQTVPGAFTRTSIKAKLLELLASQKIHSTHNVEVSWAAMAK
jgi:hypothetical protein